MADIQKIIPAIKSVASQLIMIAAFGLVVVLDISEEKVSLLVCLIALLLLVRIFFVELCLDLLFTYKTIPSKSLCECSTCFDAVLV